MLITKHYMTARQRQWLDTAIREGHPLTTESTRAAWKNSVAERFITEFPCPEEARVDAFPSEASKKVTAKVYDVLRFS